MSQYLIQNYFNASTAHLNLHRARLLFRWLAIPWMQSELDSYIFLHNNSRRRADRHKVLPHGIPADIFEHATDYGMQDFRVGYTI